MMSIGPSVRVPVDIMRRIQWTDAKKAVRELLVVVFTAEVLRTSSMTGRPSNGNKYRETGREVRPALDQEKLKDVIGKYFHAHSGIIQIQQRYMQNSEHNDYT